MRLLDFTPQMVEELYRKTGLKPRLQFFKPSHVRPDACCAMGAIFKGNGGDFNDYGEPGAKFRNWEEALSSVGVEASAKETMDFAFGFDAAMANEPRGLYSLANEAGYNIGTYIREKFKENQ